jgi:glyoxylase-like metal-dependent hydrolase (beta-lactamase superfamily II)
VRDHIPGAAEIAEVLLNAPIHAHSAVERGLDEDDLIALAPRTEHL